MRRTDQKVSPDRKVRRREWNLYSGPMKDFFGKKFRVELESYRIEGWISRNPARPIYVVRERDNVPFVVSPNEVPDTAYFSN